MYPVERRVVEAEGTIELLKQEGERFLHSGTMVVEAEGAMELLKPYELACHDVKVLTVAEAEGVVELLKPAHPSC